MSNSKTSYNTFGNNPPENGTAEDNASMISRRSGKTARRAGSSHERHNHAEVVPLQLHHDRDDEGSDDEGSDDDDDLQRVDAEAQAGVQQIEATAITWSRNELLLSQLHPWVTSEFQMHSLTPLTNILSSLIGGLWKLTLAKVLDIFGRPQGYAMSVFILTIGLMMMALCRNVETYCAAQVVYWVGYNGVIYSLSIFIADTSALRSRGLMLAYGNSPYIITAWIGGPISQAFLDGPGFRWGFATFAIATPILTLPLYFLLMAVLKRAKARGLVPVQKSGRTVKESIRHYSREFDLIGLALVTVGMAIFLLSFNLAPLQAQGWQSPLIISMLVLGPALLTIFVFWEKSLPDQRTFLPFSLLQSRTILGACLLSAGLFISFYIWNSYFLSYLQVVHDLDTTISSYIYYIFNMGGCFTSLFVGLIIRRRGTFKNFALYGGCPSTSLAGILLICEQLAAQSTVDHQHIAVIFAVQGVFASVGGAIGSTVSTSIWQVVFRRELERNLPPSALPQIDHIYADMGKQKSFPMGSDVRIAINEAYASAMTRMLVPAIFVLFPCVGFVMMWKNLNVKNVRQVRGTVL
ncbi:unnamed protein product [Parascedosporium putredinis]|uniref:Siderophore iron transporter mirB n=1 Tax=Parascedosporium putredinis TaxID=1442378 RepID=A0A9P1GXC2_9PEZI|nr:unnamed protein product [Parascedosporium putredinis]CAI7988882.1 unnamed protein product [Parascedosporium putredinis]